LIKAGGRTISTEIRTIINSISIRRNWLKSGWSQSLYLFIRKVIKQTALIIEVYYFCQLRTIFFPIILLSKLTPYAGKLLWIISVDFDETDQLLDMFHTVVLVFNIKYLLSV
jgi:hypothetical protein